MKDVNSTVMIHEYMRSQLIKSLLKDFLIEKATSFNQSNQIAQVNFN